MIDRYLIHYFLAVMDNGNFTRAAQQCRVSQPTLSVGIAKLESLVGHSLFHRTNRRVEVTRFGATFAHHARRIEAEFAKALQAMASDQESQLVRIGIIATLPSAWIERATREACQVEGERLEIVEGRMRELLPRLDRGRIDVILGALGDTAPTRDILFEEGYALALSADHPLAQRKTLEPDEVAACEMIVRRNCEALPDVSRFFTQRGIRPFFAARTTNDDRAVALVRAGLGVTVMPKSFEQCGIAMPHLAGFDQRRKIGLRWDDTGPSSIRHSKCISRFSAIIRQCASGEVSRS